MELKPTTKFKEYLASAGITETIYSERDRPTANLPNVFIEVSQNGAIRGNSERIGILSCTLLVGIYVKLLTTGAANVGKEDLVLGKFKELFTRECLTHDKYHFQLSNNMVSQGRNITAGYSYVLMNVDCKIY